jgi:hypothetical protein
MPLVLRLPLAVCLGTTSTQVASVPGKFRIRLSWFFPFSTKDYLLTRQALRCPIDINTVIIIIIMLPIDINTVYLGACRMLG